MTAKNCLTGLTIVATLVALISTPTAYFLDRLRLNAIRVDNAICVSNLKLIERALESYAGEAKNESYPLLSAVSGRIMFSPDFVLPSHLQDVNLLISPYHPACKHLKQKALSDPKSVIDDHSYWYVGFAFANERSAQAWIAAYKQYVPRGLTIPEVDTVWPEYVKDFEAREREMSRRIEEFDRETKRLQKEDPMRPLKRSAPQNSPFTYEWNAQRMLTSGIAGYFVRDVGNPVGWIEYARRIPILIERPELHGNGGHVLYMDGHVAFVLYPGPFPMAKDFIEGLRSLDKLEK